MTKRNSHAEIQSLLDSRIVVQDLPLPVETLQQTLPLGSLSWENFERLSARLISAEGAVFECHRYGKPGEEQSGIDIIARKWLDGRVEKWVYQCKKYAHFTESDARKAIQALEYEADQFVILLSSVAGKKVRDIIAKSPRMQIWDAEDISRRLKDHPRIVEDFFGRAWRRAFCGESPQLPSDSSQAQIRRLVGIELNHVEWIHSNLLSVTRYPRFIYGASTPLRPSSATTSEELAKIPPVKTARGMAWAFADLRNPVFAGLIGCDPEQVRVEKVDHWLDQSRERNWLRELFYEYLRRKCASMGMAYDSDHNRFYFTPEDGKPRIKTYRSFKRKATRKLAYPYEDKDTGQVRFWVHHAARLSFAEFDSRFFLKVEPGYAFTQDGITFLDSEDIGPLATRRKSGERNQNVFNHLIFWSEILAGPDSEIIINCEGQELVISKLFESGEASFGIPSDGELLADIAMTQDELDLSLIKVAEYHDETE